MKPEREPVLSDEEVRTIETISIDPNRKYQRVLVATLIASHRALRAQVVQYKRDYDHAKETITSFREIVGQWIWSVERTALSYDVRDAVKAESALACRLRQLDDLINGELPPPVLKAEQLFRWKQRDRINELEAQLAAQDTRMQQMALEINEKAIKVAALGHEKEIQ